MKRRTVIGALAASGVVQAVGAGKASASVGTVVDDNYWTNIWQAKNDWIWSGGDQCTTFKHNNFTYWIFGDTIQSGPETSNGAHPAGWRMVPNTILLQQGTTFIKANGDGSDGVPKPPTATDANGERYWTQGMFAANSYLYVLCQRVKHNSEGGFSLPGSEIAKFSQNTTTGKLTLREMLVTPSTGIDQSRTVGGIQWANDALVHGGYVYIYGSQLAGENDKFIPHFGYVARVATASIGNPFAWRFYKKTTNTWVARVEELDQDPGAGLDSIVESQISSVRYINGKFVMLDKPWNNWGSTVYISTSPTPYGPWTRMTLFESPAGTFEGLEYETYAPMLHPELGVDASGRTLISMKWNFKNGTLATIGSNADLYKPRFHRVLI